MEIKYSKGNKMFKPFFDEVSKYKEGVHRFNKGISENKLEIFERSKGITLPAEYKEFLKICNGGELFAVPSGTILSGLLTDPSNFIYGESYINNGFSYENEEYDLPINYLIIGNANYGDLYCLDLDNSSMGRSRIIEWDHENKTNSETWNSVKDWLLDLLTSTGEYIDYNGEEKDQ